MTIPKELGWCNKYTKALMLYAEGKTQEEIATRLGIGRVHMNRLLNSPEWQEKIKYYEKTAGERAMQVFAQQAERAAGKIVELMDSARSENVKLLAAREILYQVGCKPREVIETIKREYAPQEVTAAYATLNEMQKVAHRLSENESKFVVSRTIKTAEVSDNTLPIPTSGADVRPIEASATT